MPVGGQTPFPGGGKGVVGNADLFYDPAMDDDDQRWVDRQRGRYLGYRPGAAPSEQAAANSRGGIEPAGASDAVLNCPACLTTLCVDCQQHDVYETQFRAMFVLNCRVDRTEQLHFRDKKAPPRRKSKGAPPAPVRLARLPFPLFRALPMTMRLVRRPPAAGAAPAGRRALPPRVVRGVHHRGTR